MKIEWKGGECPVSGDTLVNVYLANGTISLCEAGEWSWLHGGGRSDIIAYEVIEEEPKQITEKTLWDEYAMLWMSKLDRQQITANNAASECAFIADEMMKARAK